MQDWCTGCSFRGLLLSASVAYVCVILARDIRHSAQNIPSSLLPRREERRIGQRVLLLDEALASATASKSTGDNASSIFAVVAAKECGPAELNGIAKFGVWDMKIIPWLGGARQTGTGCKHISFRARFINANDVRVVVTADRTECGGSAGPAAPVVWVESVHRDGFTVCLQQELPSDKDSNSAPATEHVKVSWWAVNSRATKLGTVPLRMSTDLTGNTVVCYALDEAADPKSRTVLGTVNHGGIKYTDIYMTRWRVHTPRESAMTWIVKRGGGKYDMCARRLHGGDPDLLEDVHIDTVSVKNGTAGAVTGEVVVKLDARARGCTWVDQRVGEGGMADTLLFTQASTDDDGGHVHAWVEQRSGLGFLTCAQDAGRDRVGKAVTIHWAVTKHIDKSSDDSFCQAAPADQ